ncbi:MAG: hypothetical protein V3S24_04160, partial [Candidatus Tectomicrobia bacterium]
LHQTIALKSDNYEGVWCTCCPSIPSLGRLVSRDLGGRFAFSKTPRSAPSKRASMLPFPAEVVFTDASWD